MIEIAPNPISCGAEDGGVRPAPRVRTQSPRRGRPSAGPDRGAVFALVLAACAAPAAADDEPCAALAAEPGAAVSGEGLDRLVLAPAPNGALRFCFWNSPHSSGRAHAIDVAGERVTVRVEVDSAGPERFHVDLPGAVATDPAGVPLPEIAAPDREAVEGLLWRGLM